MNLGIPLKKAVVDGFLGSFACLLCRFLQGLGGLCRLVREGAAGAAGGGARGGGTSTKLYPLRLPENMAGVSFCN